jgi:chromosome segregation ATPase
VTPGELRAELRHLQRRATALEADRTRAQEALTAALGEDTRRYSPADVSMARRVVAQLDRARAELQDRIAALTAQLPSPGERKATTAEASALGADATAARTRLEAAERAFVEVLETAERAARALLEARTADVTTHARLTQLVRDTGVDVEAPPAHSPDPQAEALAHLQVLLLRQTVRGAREIDATLRRDLEAQRAARDAMPVPA